MMAKVRKLRNTMWCRLDDRTAQAIRASANRRGWTNSDEMRTALAKVYGTYEDPSGDYPLTNSLSGITSASPLT